MTEHTEKFGFRRIYPRQFVQKNDFFLLGFERGKVFFEHRKGLHPTFGRLGFGVAILGEFVGKILELVAEVGILYACHFKIDVLIQGIFDEESFANPSSAIYDDKFGFGGS